MAFPFLYLTLSLASGILFSFLLPFSNLILLPLLLVFFVLAWILYFLKKNRTCFVFIILSFFTAGSILYIYQNHNYEQNSLHRMKASDYADFYGYVYKSVSPRRDKYYIYLKVTKVVYNNKVQPIQGNLRISIPRSSSSFSCLNLYVKDKVKVSAKLSQFKGFRNFYGTPLNRYLKIKNIHRRAFTKSPLLVEKIKSGNKFSPLRFVSVLRENLQQKIKQYFTSNSSFLSAQGAVLEALLLGERGRMDENISRSLQDAGLFHLFAISGAHIAIISFLLFSIFRIFHLPQRTSYLILILFLIFFAFLVEGRTSVIRATIMAVTFLLGKLLWKNVNLLNTISISAFFLLLFNPFNLFDTGFQLTFTATLSIILFFPKIMAYLPPLPFRISEIFALSLSAQLGILPLIAYSFNRIAFSSLILNYVALPLVGIIMGCGYIFLTFSFISTFLAQTLSFALQFFIKILLLTAHVFDPVPFLSFRVPTPHLFTVGGYFLFLLLLLVPSRWKGQKTITAGGLGLFLAVLIIYPFPDFSKNLKTTFIDVGQGESILIEFPGGKKMLVDGGGFRESAFDVGENVVSPFLWNKGIKKIDYVVLSHAHPDHLNGLKAVARNFPIGEYWEAFSPAEEESYAEFRNLLPLSVPKKRLFRGHSFSLGKTKIAVLHPPEDKPFVSTLRNNQSLVLRITYGQTSFLLTGDIGAKVERQIIKHFPHVQSQVLKSPHHGSDSSSSLEFLEKVKPQLVVISVGVGNVYGFPDQKVLNNYHKVGARVYRTDVHGAVEITSDGKNISVRTATGENTAQK